MYARLVRQHRPDVSFAVILLSWYLLLQDASMARIHADTTIWLELVWDACERDLE